MGNYCGWKTLNWSVSFTYFTRYMEKNVYTKHWLFKISGKEKPTR